MCTFLENGLVTELLPKFAHLPVFCCGY